MQVSEAFSKAEDEYFVLRGQYIAGRITREELDAALKRLMVQDPQGRYWVLGPDSGKWYVHEGQNWVEADPAVVLRPATAPAASIQPRSFMVPLIAGAMLIFLCLLIVGALGWAASQGLFSVAMAPTPTATRMIVVQATGTAAVQTAAPVTAPSLTPTTSGTATLLPTSVISFPGVTPSFTLAPTLPSPTAIQSPTLAPATVTLTPAPAATLVLPTPTVAVAPGMYVVGMRINPPAPRRGQLVVFYPKFLNTTGGDAYYRWLVFIYRQSNLTKSFGETTVLPGTIPMGETEQKSVENWRVTGLSACENYVARVMWTPDNNKTRLPFIKPDGSTLDFPFQVCP